MNKSEEYLKEKGIRNKLIAPSILVSDVLEDYHKSRVNAISDEEIMEEINNSRLDINGGYSGYKMLEIGRWVLIKLTK